MYEFKDYYQNTVQLSFDDQPFSDSPKHVWVICRFGGKWLLTEHEDRGYEFPGGKVEPMECAEEAALREVKEETGYTLTDYRFRGIITFLYRDVCEYMCLYTADGFTGEPRECDEGTLEWVEINKVEELDLWEGDKIFFRLLH